MTSTYNMSRVSFFARLFGSRPAAASQAPPFEAGVAALERGRFDEAFAYFAAALETAASGPQRALVHNKCALVSLQRGDRSATIAALVAALEADPRCVPAIVNVGNLLLEDANLDDAVAHYEAALRIDETYAAGHLNVGIAYKRLGRRADAVRAFRRADRIQAGLRAPRS